MGFNKMYLPEVVELENFLIKHGNDSFYSRWCMPFMRRDAVIGPSESIEYIKQFIESEYNDSRPSTQLNNGVGQ